MRAKTERRARTARCPECGEYFSPQGLSGHLRFTHGIKGREVKQKMSGASVATGVAERSRQTLDLVAQIKAVQQELQELASQGSLFGFFKDETLEDCKAALRDRELELRNEIRKMRDNQSSSE